MESLLWIERFLHERVKYTTSDLLIYLVKTDKCMYSLFHGLIIIEAIIVFIACFPDYRLGIL